jgi:D-lactate dehydrogenase (cytochrome)
VAVVTASQSSARFLTEDSRARVRVLVAELQARYGARVSTAPAVRQQHGRGEALDAGAPPDAVVWPESTAEVADIVRACAARDIPIIPFGAGTSVEGHVSAPFGGICVDVSRMNAVLVVNADDADCVVQPGVTRNQLNAYLRDSGLFFPVDPGADASIGGMVSTRASGTTTVRYGGMPQQVLALEVVLADGRVIRCGSRARKSSAGYDLVRMFVGSEGTLGIVTEITLRLHGRAEAIGSLTCSFATMREAVDTVTALSLTGAGVARIEFLDEVQIRACNQYSKLDLPEQPTLFIEFHGIGPTVEEQIARAAEIAVSFGGTNIGGSTSEAERERLWKARHAAYFAALALRPGCQAMIADVCVPISALADCVVQTRAAIDAAGLQAPIVGHVGDGNFHVIFLLDPAARTERERADAVYDDLIERALAVGGTCTGEHGIGYGKRHKLVREAGDDAIGLMRAVKTAWDPRGILNPGKIFLDATEQRS